MYKAKVGDCIEFCKFGTVYKGKIVQIGKYGFWISSPDVPIGHIQCFFDQDYKIRKK